MHGITIEVTYDLRPFSMGLLYDKFSNGDRNDRPACKREDLHVKETHTLPQLDRGPNQR